MSEHRALPADGPFFVGNTAELVQLKIPVLSDAFADLTPEQAEGLANLLKEHAEAVEQGEEW